MAAEESVASTKDATIVLNPPVGHDGAPHAALVFYPGAFVDGSHYSSFATELQAKLAGKVHLWVCLIVIDWPRHIAERPKTGTTPQLLQQHTLECIVPQLESQGFKALKDETGEAFRYLNVFTGAHSLGGIYSREEALKSAGPMILTGSRIMGKEEEGVEDFLEFPYPILVTIGELDGQLGWPKALQDFGDMLKALLLFGKKHALKHKSLAIIPSMNHMQICKGEPRMEMGGIQPAMNDSQVIESNAEVVAAFIHLHASQEFQSESYAVLEKAVFGPTMDVMMPYAEACGLKEGQSILDKISAHRGDTEFPEVDIQENRVALEECVKMQKKLFKDQGRIPRIAPVVVTSLETFLISNPYTIEAYGHQVVVPICFGKKRARIGYFPPPIGPEYWMKLMPVQGVEYSTAKEQEGKGKEVISLWDICREQNEEHFQTALKKASKESVKRYYERGIPIAFLPDAISNQDDVTLEDWANDENPIKYRYNQETKMTEVQSQIHKGNKMIGVKTISLGRGLEYLAIQSMQQPISE